MDAVDSTGMVVTVSVWAQRINIDPPRSIVVLEPVERTTACVTFDSTVRVTHNYISLGREGVLVQELYDFSRNKLQQKVSQWFLVNRGVLYDILKV